MTYILLISLAFAHGSEASTSLHSTGLKWGLQFYECSFTRCLAVNISSQLRPQLELWPKYLWVPFACGCSAPSQQGAWWLDSKASDPCPIRTRQMLFCLLWPRLRCHAVRFLPHSKIILLYCLNLATLVKFLLPLGFFIRDFFM